MNHAGYATAQDLTELNVDVVKTGWEDATVDEYYDYIEFDNDAFKDWWGPQWVRGTRRELLDSRDRSSYPVGVVPA